MAEIDESRREAIRLLCQAHASDRISVEVFESRLEQVRHAPNDATIAAILADLDEESPFPAPVVTRSALRPITDEHHAMDAVEPAEYIRIASVFGSTKRAGSWTAPLVLGAKVLFGEMTVDLRDAVFGSDVMDIEVDVALGSFSLIVPAGTQVENEVEETLASSTYSTRSARGARPNGLLIRIRGRAVLGSIDIKEKFPTGATKPLKFLGWLGGDSD